MQDIWVYSEDQELSKQILTLGKEAKQSLQKKVYLLTTEEEFALEAASCGADVVYLLRSSNGIIIRPESLAKGVAQLVNEESPSVFFVGGTLRGKEFAAKVAALADSGMITDANAITFNNGVRTDRMVYGGLAIISETLGEKALVTIPPKNFDAAVKGETSGEIIVKEIDIEQNIAVVQLSPVVREGADISSASKVICVGRGLAKKEDLALAQDLATAVGGEIGCTRGIAEDYGWLPVELYIGLSGQKVKPELYVSMGVSGQVQHVAGIRDSKIIVAVDRNESAPIFEAADYGIVGDLYEVIPALTQAIKSVVGK